jgi:hypothetical protein
MYGEWSYLYTLTSVLDGGEWSTSGSSCFTSRERAPDTYQTEGWVGPKARLKAVGKRKSLAPAMNQTMICYAILIRRTGRKRRL